MKQKVFEFVFVSTEDCVEKDTMLFSESMVSLRGLIEITTANEVEIRRELGQAIRLKCPMVTNDDFEFVRANRRRITKPVSCNEYNYQQIKILAGQGCIYIKMKDGFECLCVEKGPEDNKFDFEKDGKKKYSCSFSGSSETIWRESTNCACSVGKYLFPSAKLT